MKLGTILTGSPQLQKGSTSLRACTGWCLGRLSMPAVVLGGMLVAQQMYWTKSSAADTVNRGPAVWSGVPVWRVQATVFRGGPAGGQLPVQRGNLVMTRSNGALAKIARRLLPTPGTARRCASRCRQSVALTPARRPPGGR